MNCQVAVFIRDRAHSKNNIHIRRNIDIEYRNIYSVIAIVQVCKMLM